MRQGGTTISKHSHPFNVNNVLRHLPLVSHSRITSQYTQEKQPAIFVEKWNPQEVTCQDIWRWPITIIWILTRKIKYAGFIEKWLEFRIGIISFLVLAHKTIILIHLFSWWQWSAENLWSWWSRFVSVTGERVLLNANVMVHVIPRHGMSGMWKDLFIQNLSGWSQGNAWRSDNLPHLSKTGQHCGQLEKTHKE